MICPSADTNDPFGADTEGPRCGRSARRAPAPWPSGCHRAALHVLASEEASHVTGQIFHQRGAGLSLYSQPRPIRTITRIWVGRSRRSATKRCRRWRRISSISRIPVTSTQDCRWNKHKLRIRREGRRRNSLPLFVELFDICATARRPAVRGAFPFKHAPRKARHTSPSANLYRLNFVIALPLCFDLGKRPQRHTERPILRPRRSEQRPHDDISAENGNADEKHLAEARFRQPFAHFLTDIHTYKRRHQTDEREQPKIRGQQTAAGHGNTERNG